MVLLPYKDRLELFSRYLQQLVMESLGKRLDLAGNVVHQGIAVYGNKGSTDQHAYVQQLRDGLDNFFITFIEVLRDRAPERPVLFVERAPREASPPATTSSASSRARAARSPSPAASPLTLTVETVDAATLGRLIALYERAVGLYASLVGINAYHQPGVEAGKKAAQTVLDLEAKVLAALHAAPGEELDARGRRAARPAARIWRRCSPSCATSRRNAWRGVTVTVPEGKGVFDATYRLGAGG